MMNATTMSGIATTIIANKSLPYWYPQWRHLRSYVIEGLIELNIDPNT